jgi:DNA-binding winged helix-turn-helix (wHTH) protein
VLHFLQYCLDEANARLRRGTEVIPLRPKTLALLGYLAARQGRLATKQELLDALWSDATVGEWVLTSCVRELRRALDDDPRHPRVIETAPGHGYRFIADVRAQPVERSSAVSFAAISGPAAESISLVGRAAELAQLDAWWQHAVNGQRQVVFIAGEPGIGKTTLVGVTRRGETHRPASHRCSRSSCFVALVAFETVSVRLRS